MEKNYYNCILPTTTPIRNEQHSIFGVIIKGSVKQQRREKEKY
jgi:hypothetical protein